MDPEHLGSLERGALEEFLQMTPEDVAARAAAFAAADDPLELGHAAAAERWRKLEREMREADAATVADLPERARDRWARRLNARSRTFSRPDPGPPQVDEAPAGWPADLAKRTRRAWELGRTRDPRHARALAALLRSDDEPTVRADAARGLGSVGGDEAVAALLAVTTPDPRIRNAIARALGVLGDARAVPRLAEWLEAPPVREEAATALGRIGGAAAVPALEKGLTAWPWSDRGDAREALVALGHPDAVEALRRNPRRSPLARRRELAAAERAVARRRARQAGESPRRPDRLAVRLAAGGVKALLSLALLLWLAAELFAVDPAVYRLTLGIPGTLLALVELIGVWGHHRLLDLARHRAAGEPTAEPRPAAETVLRLLGERPLALAGFFALALGGEWATRGSGIPSGLVAALFLGAALDRLLKARVVRRWQRASGESLLVEGADRGPLGRRRTFFARREV